MRLGGCDVLTVRDFACIVARADRGIAYSSNMHACVAFELGASEIAIHCNLPVALGVLPDAIHRGDVLQYTLTAELSQRMSGTVGVAVIQSGGQGAQVSA